MKFEVYLEEIKRTRPDLGEFKGNPIILNSIHMSVGIFGEVYEINGAFDKVNLAEELTDVLWYVGNYCNVRGFVPQTSISNTPIQSAIFSQENIDDAFGVYINSISEIQDYDKKELAYGKVYGQDIQDRREFLANQIIACFNFLYQANEIDAEQAMQNNIDKLYERFPAEKGFNEESANNRNIEAERKHLEN